MIDSVFFYFHSIFSLFQQDDKKDELRLAHAYEPEFHTAFGTLGFTAFLLIVLSYFLSVATWNVSICWLQRSTIHVGGEVVRVEVIKVNSSNFHLA